MPRRAVVILSACLGALVVAAPASADWKGRYLDKAGDFSAVKVAFDDGGRLHAAALSAPRTRLRYYGPAGARTVDPNTRSKATAFGFAVLGDRPLLSWQAWLTERVAPDYCPQCTGVDRNYDQLRWAGGPAFEHGELARTDENGSGFLFNDIAADRQTGALHAAYSYGRADQLVYQAQDGAATALPLRGVQAVDIAAGAGTVAVAAANAGKLVLFTRSGAGGWKQRALGRSAGSFDIAVGVDGRARVAVGDGPLRLWTGGRMMRSKLGVDQVAIGVDRGGRMHVGYTRAKRPTCRGYGIFGRVCSNNGIGYLRVNATGTRAQAHGVVKGHIGYSPRLSLAVTPAGKVAIGYADPSRNYRPAVRTRG
jgi:hypothetical protein